MDDNAELQKYEDLSPELRRERREKLNRLVLIGASCGAVPGLIGGVAAAGVLGTVQGMIIGALGGMAGGSASSLLIVIRVGIDNDAPLWQFVVFGIIGGLVGGVGLVTVIKWIELFKIWRIKQGKWLFDF